MEKGQGSFLNADLLIKIDKIANPLTFFDKSLDQWFPTTVPRNTCVPPSDPKCSAEIFS